MALTLLTFLVMAVVTDFKEMRISNRLIVSGLFWGLALRVMAEGYAGIAHFLMNISIPVILLFLLFLMRALGAGDIKLFSVVGGICGFQWLFLTMAASFLVGACMSLCKMAYHRSLIARLAVFGNYVRQSLAEGRILKYPQEPEGKQHIIHFSIAILIGYGITMGVIG